MNVGCKLTVLLLGGCALPIACLKCSAGLVNSTALIPAVAAAAAAAAAADVPEVAEGIYEKLRTQWLKLQKHSDAVSEARSCC
jgi:hypothetical protein